MSRDRLHPSMYLPGPHKSTAELILCDRLGSQASGARAKRGMLLELAQLAGGGLTAAHLGALLAAGCLEEGCISHKRPARTGKPNQATRARDLQPGLLLTEFGRTVFACYLDRPQDRGAKDLWITKAVQAFRRMAERPLWKAVEGELWWRGRLVKRYRNDAADQRCVLAAFQARGWPNCHENPLPNCHHVNRKSRLRYTVKDLNRGQHPQRIRFRCNGRGGIRWEANI